METKYWTKVKEFQGVQLLRDPETMQCRFLPIEKPQPQTKAEPQISPERKAWIDAAYARYLAGQAAIQPQPQPERLRTPEETWRYSPALRAEFNNNLGAYLAYCKAAESGRCRVYGGVS